MVPSHEVPVEDVAVHAFDIPVDGPDGKEQDGTLTWESVTIVLVEARAGGLVGIGYTYGDVATAALIASKLAAAVRRADAMAPPAAWRQMSTQLRNAGQPGIGAMAVSAVDIAPAVSAHAFCAVPHLRHLEYFHTHVRLEGIAFDGTLSPAGGALRPDPGRPGLGLEVKWADLERYRIYGGSRG